MKRGVSLLIFCQSLGWDLMQKFPFVDGLAENRSSMKAILGSPAATLPTVLSGALPQEHGHFDWFFYSPGTSPFRLCKYLAYLPAPIRRSLRFRNAVVRSIRNSCGMTGRLSVFNMPLKRLPMLDFVEHRSLLEPAALGELRTLIDFFVTENIRYFRSEHKLTDPENADALTDALQAGKISAAFLHLTGIDQVLKREGAGSPAVRGRMAWFDHRIRRLYETAAMRYDNVELIIFSDCGAIPVSDTFDLKAHIEAGPHTWGRDYAAVYSPAMAQFWFLRAERRAAMLEMLNSLPCGRILSKQETVRQGCWFADNRFGEAIFLAHPGVAFTPNYIEAAPPAAASAYHPDNEATAAAFACNLAGVQPPRSLPDVRAVLVRSAGRCVGIDVAAGEPATARRPE
ncbi:MAG: alkaline phosphatase family protein [Planctomycetes bacterium]|nr:alkaline phosphatase family protein [Planctomycetota bacterium]